MNPIPITKDIHWVGAVDWNSRNFHGYSLSPMGTTYNNFLIIDEKVTLVDTVMPQLKNQMMCNIEKVLDGRSIDYLVLNHLEFDHAGCVLDVVEKYNPEKIFTSPMGQKSLQGQFHHADWPVEVMPTGSSVSIGKHTLNFIETRMLHWPDSMLTYIPEAKVAFCNDGFGQNIASSERWADEYDRFVLELCMKEYYANILLPFSSVVLKTLKALGEMNLDIQYLLPDHGLMYRNEDVAFAFDKYQTYAQQKPKKKAVLVYDSMWKSTEKMATAIATGLVDEGISVKLMSMKANHHSRVMTEVFDAAAVLVGSPTHNNGILPSMAGMLTYMKGLKPQNKIGAAFGSFGWSGECVKVLNQWLEDMNFETIIDPVKNKFVPTHDTYGQCYELGKSVAAAIKKKLDQ